ncbi:serine hydrolase [Salinimicrobium flavum]|uniref:Serine hydrolase n=1 Tax=Salinimicrobium flavum TaxID=1737065 RepID=A0ABW5IYD6_9FLAO
MKHVPVILVALLAATTAFSQQVHLDNLEKKVDSITGISGQENEPGLSVGVVYRGRPVLNSHSGLMNLENQVKTSGSTMYNLASVSKHITAFGILLLEAEGKLELQDRVGDYLPDLPKEFKEVTIDQLLHHTSGIPSTDNLRLFAGIPLDVPWTMADEMDLLKKYSHLNFEPGTDFMYSNGGYSLLAAIIEMAGDQEFDDYFRQKVFDPNDLQAVAYSNPEKSISNRATGYRLAGDTLVDARTETESVPGGSNFYFNMNDMLVWMDLLLKENPPYSQQISKMMKASFTLPTGDTIPYSHGLNVKPYKGVKAVYHSGGTPGFASYMMLFPEQELGIAVLTNNEKINVSRIIRKLADGILSEFIKEEKPLERVAISLTEDKLKKWEGGYRMEDGLILKILPENEALFLVLPEAQRFQLHAESETNYFISEFDARVVFSTTPEGKPFQFKLIQGTNVQTGTFTEPAEFSQVPPDPQALIGSYYQPELDVTYRLEAIDGVLMLQLPETFEKYLNFYQVTLKPVLGNVFNTDRLGVVEFLQNEQDEITGLRFNDVGRLRHISFTKIN